MGALRAALRRWLSPEPEPDEGSLIAFRRWLLMLLAGLAFYGSWLLFLWIPEGRVASWAEIRVGLFGVVLGTSTFLLRRNWPRRAAWLFLAGSLALDYGVCRVFDPQIAPALFILTVLASGLLLRLRPHLGVSAAAAGVALLAALPAAQLFWVFMIAAAAAMAAVAGTALELVDHWERETTLRQGTLILQLRERQGELNRTLKALDEAYESLKRSNHELYLARQAAEEARVLKEQFVANVSHELRTPLNLIVGFAEIMYLSPESYDGVRWTPELANDIREMYRASRHLRSLIDDILDLSRIDAARLPMFRELLDVRTVIAEALETIAPLLRQRKLAYQIEMPAALPQLFVDRTRIRQVMLNLLNNAARFTDSGGLTVRVALAGEAVQVSVQDTGVGIAADQLELIFEEFRQAESGPHNRGGTGLGLAISRRFVELHGGRMWAASQVGRGSTFYFSLPLPGAVPQTTTLVRTPLHGPLDLQAAPALLVEPDPSIADMLSRYLVDRRVLAAADPKEADRLVEAEHPAAVIVNQPPDAPREQWLGFLGPHSERYGVPVIRCSIPSLSWLRGPSGANEFLTKPVSRDALARVFSQYGHPRRILVVDDDTSFAGLMERMLRTLGSEVRVITAAGGPHALRLARENPPDLVLLDLLMPEMDGFQVLAVLREDPTLRKVPVVVVTATSYDEEALRQLGGHLTISLARGIPTGPLIEILNTVLEVLKPRYA